jgi:hypothetical protein
VFLVLAVVAIRAHPAFVTGQGHPAPQAATAFASGPSTCPKPDFPAPEVESLTRIQAVAAHVGLRRSLAPDPIGRVGFTTPLGLWTNAFPSTSGDIDAAGVPAGWEVVNWAQGPPLAHGWALTYEQGAAVVVYADHAAATRGVQAMVGSDCVNRMRLPAGAPPGALAFSELYGRNISEVTVIFTRGRMSLETVVSGALRDGSVVRVNVPFDLLTARAVKLACRLTIAHCRARPTATTGDDTVAS